VALPRTTHTQFILTGPNNSHIDRRALILRAQIDGIPAPMISGIPQRSVVLRRGA
jgi:hypothetical protein